MNCQNGLRLEVLLLWDATDSVWCCVCHRALQEHHGNHGGKILILHTYEFSAVLRPFLFTMASRTGYLVHTS